MTLQIMTEPAVPEVSVLMPCHRVDDYLRLAIRSMLQQTLTEFELLIVMDWRLHGADAQVLACAAGDSRVRLVQALPVGGLAAGLNLGIAQARGRYIARMDSDDISLPQRLAVQARYLDVHPATVAVGSMLALIDEDGAPVHRAYPLYETDREIRAVLPLRNPMPHPALMFRREALLAVGGYKYAHSAEDWELFLRLARNEKNRLHNLNQVLVHYRRHSGQVTRPELTRSVFCECAGFLFTELLLTGSPKYLLGILIKVPLLVHARLALRRLLGRADSAPRRTEIAGRAGLAQ